MTEAPIQHAELSALAVPIDQLRPHPDNPRQGDVPAIARSMVRNGQYKPIVYQRSTGFILAGNHTWLAAKQLGSETIAALGVDVDDALAKRIMLADNRTAELASYDQEALADLLTSIDAPELEGTGWTPDDVDDVLADIAADTPVIPLPAQQPPQAGSEVAAGADPTGPPAPAAPHFTELDEPPRTEARYAETDEELAARAESRAQMTPHVAKGVVEMILVYTPEDRAEAARLIAAARETYGPEARANVIVLHALRGLVALLDSRQDPTATVTVGTLLHAVEAFPRDEGEGAA